MDRYGGWPRSGTADEMGVARRLPIKLFCERLAYHGHWQSADENIEFQVRFALRGEIRFNLQTLFVLELTTNRLF